jgi:hypothetical protein
MLKRSTAILLTTIAAAGVTAVLTAGADYSILEVPQADEITDNFRVPKTEVNKPDGLTSTSDTAWPRGTSTKRGRWPLIGDN